MLKSDLIRPRIEKRGSRVQPRMLRADYHWLGVAQDLIGLYGRFLNHPRAALTAALRDYEGDSIDYPIIRGLASVLASRATFNSDPPVKPAELRKMLFTRGPITAVPNLFQPKTRVDLIKDAAETYKIRVEEVESALFADLAEEQILQDLGDPINAKALIERYNLEVARGLLYWAREIELHVEDGYQQLFKYIKLMGLMYTIYPSDVGYDIVLHGPLSPFVKSTIRYGLQFAKFMPALLLCDTWQMEAQVRPPGQDKFLQYILDDQTSLKTHFKAKTGFDSKLEANFATEFEEKYNKANRVWELAYEDELILVGDSVMIPDFSFTHKKNGRRALLEIVGFWHPAYLRRKLKKIKEAGRSDLIVLVYESVNVADGVFEEASAGEVIKFKKKPVLKDVIAAIERSAI
ncbi:MAG: DUF790 family protein [Chloroflexi bacterium]|nr:DUF790 family protein [Chloroflexota bacterium]